MYICNHQSNVDIPVLIAALGTVAFLSKKLVKRIPFIGRCAYCAGTVYFSRSNKTERARALGETLRMCRKSTAVVVFPEGTRRPTGEIKDRVHPRSLEACHKQGLSVVPVGLDGTWRVLNKAMDRLRRGEPVVVNIGEALDPGDYANPESFAEACWERVKELHGESRRELMEKMGS